MAERVAGNLEVIEKALETAKFKEGSRILEIGCGEGDTVNYLNQQGFQAEGIEMNLPKISTAKEKYEGINVKFGDPCFLDDYMSFTFDGIIMDHVLLETLQPDEALHEAYCVMKKGGRLIISDTYEKKPDPKQLQAVAIEADRQSHIPHKEGDCEEQAMRFVDFRFEGAFYREPLIRQLEDEIGFKLLKFEDIAKPPCSSADNRELGAFLLVAQKPL